MKAIILLAGAAALGMTVPAVAQSHHDHGNGHWNGNSDRDHGRDRGDQRWNSHEGRHDNGHHYGWYKHRQMYNRGQRWRSNYGTYYSYGRIPLSVRRHYNLRPNYRYYYNNGYYYAVDPTTMLVQQVISSILR